MRIQYSEMILFQIKTSKESGYKDEIFSQSQTSLAGRQRINLEGLRIKSERREGGGEEGQMR